MLGCVRARPWRFEEVEYGTLDRYIVFSLKVISCRRCCGHAAICHSVSLADKVIASPGVACMQHS